MTVPWAASPSRGSAAPRLGPRQESVRAAGPVLSTDIITPQIWNDGQPLPEDERRLEVEKQEMFPGWESAVDFQGTFAQLCQATPVELAHVPNRIPGLGRGSASPLVRPGTSQRGYREPCLAKNNNRPVFFFSFLMLSS